MPAPQNIDSTVEVCRRLHGYEISVSKEGGPSRFRVEGEGVEGRWLMRAEVLDLAGALRHATTDGRSVGSEPPADAFAGISYRNWRVGDSAAPPLILNREADMHSLVAWCWGEASQLEELADFLMEAPSADDQSSRLAALFWSKLRPLAYMLEELGNRTAP